MLTYSKTAACPRRKALDTCLAWRCGLERGRAVALAFHAVACDLPVEVRYVARQTIVVVGSRLLGRHSHCLDRRVNAAALRLAVEKLLDARACPPATCSPSRPRSSTLRPKASTSRRSWRFSRRSFGRARTSPSIASATTSSPAPCSAVTDDSFSVVTPTRCRPMATPGPASRATGCTALAPAT